MTLIFPYSFPPVTFFLASFWARACGDVREVEDRVHLFWVWWKKPVTITVSTWPSCHCPC